MEPGVYWFLDSNENVLYVGKAKSLKKRLTSYTQVNRLPERTKQLVKTASAFKYQTLSSELEALLVEAELIRTYLPPYNILLKDDKSPIYVHVTRETFPRVTMVRKKEIITQQLKGTILGPFQSAYKLREVLRLARDIFPWCNQRGNAATADQKPCFYYHIGLCPGACIGDISAKDYQENSTQLVAFLKGKTKQVSRDLSAKMKEAAETERFEDAAELRDQFQLITEVTQPTYRLKPDLLLGTSLSSNAAKDQLLHLRRLLHTYAGLSNQASLYRIEGYDVSNLQGQLAAVGMVVFTQGDPDSSQYRLFNIKTLDTPNDYHMLKEALQRRQNHPEWTRPHLVVIDGGKGQLRAALSVWHWQTPVISIAKRPDRLIVPIFDPKQSTHSIDLEQPTRKAISYHELKLPENHPALRLVQRIRDESHRFSKKQFTRRKEKQLLE
ncbi:MAG: GIY-YIG nuclease family protein [Patescibacteria group bacterium]